MVPDAGELGVHLRRQADALQRSMEGRIKHDTAVLESARRALMPRDSERALREPIQTLDQARQMLRDISDAVLEGWSVRLRELARAYAAHHPERVIERSGERLEHARSLLERTGSNWLKVADERMQHLSSLIRTLGPESTFARGFSVTMTAEGKVVRDASELQKGDHIVSRFARGQVDSTVE